MRDRFVGVWQILSVFDDIGDGEELFYIDFQRMTARSAKRRCVSKRECLADWVRPYGQKKKRKSKR